MSKQLRVQAGNQTVTVVLNDSATAAALVEAAPFEATANRWGREIYFTAPVAGPTAEATAATVPCGAVGFWPPGSALCLFFGPTPLSCGDEIRPASPVALVGLIEGDEALWAALEAVLDGAPVRVEAAS